VVDDFVAKAAANPKVNFTRTVLEANKVPQAEIGEIMKIAASTAPDIVEKN
jgi:hypothetical protein